MTSVLWLKFVKSFSFPRPWKEVNWFLIYSFYEWYLLCVLSPFYSAILSFQAGKPLLRRNCFFCWALVQLTAVIYKHYAWKCVFRARQPQRALIFSLCTCRECLGARDPYCGWDNKQKRCTTIEDSSNMSLWTQNITECPVSGNILYTYRHVSMCLCVKGILPVSVCQPDEDWLVKSIQSLVTGTSSNICAQSLVESTTTPRMYLP